MTANNSASMTPAVEPIPATMMPTSPRGTMPDCDERALAPFKPGCPDPTGDELGHDRENGDTG